MQQLGELQDSAEALQSQADIYTINRDPAAQAVEMRQRSDSTLPILSDANLTVAGQYDLLPKPGQPMGGMSGVAQMGFVIIDAQGIIRVQRVDIYFGDHAGQMLEILEVIGREVTTVKAKS